MIIRYLTKIHSSCENVRVSINIFLSNPVRTKLKEKCRYWKTYSRYNITGTFKNRVRFLIHMRRRERDFKYEIVFEKQ